MRLERIGIGHGNRSNGLVVAQTLLVAITDASPSC